MEIPDKLVVSVTQKDINESGASCTSCPIARAVRRLLTSYTYKNVYVNGLEIAVSFPYLCEERTFYSKVSYWLPVEAQSFVHQYDTAWKDKDDTHKCIPPIIFSAFKRIYSTLTYDQLS